MSVSATVRATTKAQTTDLDETLATLRVDVSESEKRAYGAKRKYAEFLNDDVWPEVAGKPDWYDLKIDGDDAALDISKAVKAERTALYAVLEAAGHSNKHQVWGMVKRYAKEARTGIPTKPKGPTTPRDSDTKVKEECADLYASIHRMADASGKSIKIVNEIRASIKREYGIDIDKSDK